MNSSTLRNLAIVLFALIVILIALEVGQDGAPVESGSPLFADLRDNINSIDRLTIETSGAEPIVIASEAGAWTVAARDFPANMATIREVLIALADAKVLEEKTSNPDLYEQLGVRDPAIEGSRGVLITAAGEGVSFAVIIGDLNQGSNRYVRIADQARSLLIDQNPELPDDVGGWLDNALVDVGMSEVRSATLRHADGETIRVEKAGASDSGFGVPDLPDGRELSYPTVANSVAGVLNELTFEDVRAAIDAEPDVVAEFVTFDDQSFTVDVFSGEEGSWIALSGESVAPHLDGRQFRIADFKANQLSRRWEDLLKPIDP